MEQKAGAHSAIQRTALELNSSTQQWKKSECVCWCRNLRREPLTFSAAATVRAQNKYYFMHTIFPCNGNTGLRRNLTWFCARFRCAILYIHYEAMAKFTRCLIISCAWQRREKPPKRCYPSGWCCPHTLASSTFYHKLVFMYVYGNNKRQLM